jgi:hypothetical protein
MFLPWPQLPGAHGVHFVYSPDQNEMAAQI